MYKGVQKASVSTSPLWAPGEGKKKKGAPNRLQEKRGGSFLYRENKEKIRKFHSSGGAKKKKREQQSRLLA